MGDNRKESNKKKPEKVTLFAKKKLTFIDKLQKLNCITDLWDRQGIDPLCSQSWKPLGLL